MRILLRLTSIVVFMGLSFTMLAQSNNSSGNQGQQQPYEIQATPEPPIQNGVTDSEVQPTQNGVTGKSVYLSAERNGHQLTQEEIDRISNLISLFQNQLQQINDPNDPRAIKLQTAIDELQDTLNNQ